MAIGGDHDIEITEVESGVNTQNSELRWRSAKTY